MNKKLSDKSGIPTINERLGLLHLVFFSFYYFKISIIYIIFLGYLRPSRELLEYYRKKIGEYDVEREDIMKKIDKFKFALEDQVKKCFF